MNTKGEVRLGGNYRFTEDSRIITNDERVIILSRYNGGWIKISKQCYDILNLGIQHNLNIEQLLESLADNEDRDYFKRLFEKLKGMEVISSEEYVRQVKTKKMKKIGQVYFSLTNRCNLSCVHCCIDAGKPSDDEILSTDQIINAIDKIITLDPMDIVFSGGEPMLRKDFVKILEYTAQRFKGNITISTNGTLINEENVNILTKLCNQIDISLDGIDEESCSIIRGPGVFDRVVKNIQLLKENGFKNINLSMTIGEKTEYLRENFYELNASLGTKPVVRAFSPVGRGSTNDLVLMNKKSHMAYMSENYARGISVEPLVACSCGAGYRELFINFDGNIYPCPNLIEEEYKICNINDIDDFSNLMETDYTQINAYKHLAEIEPDSIEKCKECKVNMFCWTCLEDVKRLKNYEGDFVERCSIIKPMLYDKIWGDLSKEV